jgi:hypothetical protein
MAYRDAPMEPVSGTEETDALKDEMKFQKRKAEAKKAKESYKKKKKVADTAASEDAYSYKCGGKVKYSTGGGVCAGGRSAIRGTKFVGVK